MAVRVRDVFLGAVRLADSSSGYTAALMNDALATSTDRRTALAHFVLQMRPHEAELLQQTLDQAHPRLEEGGTP